jgi:hypothetical protein
VSSSSYKISGVVNKLLENNQTSTHFRGDIREIDMLFNVDLGELCFQLVGSSIAVIKFDDIPTDNQNGWVPHFDIYTKQVTIRLAKISISWFGIQKQIQWQ